MASRTADKNKWIVQNLDRINLTVPKGQKQVIQAHAQARNESVNGFINRVINEAITKSQEEKERAQRIAQIAACKDKSIAEVEHAMEIESALAVLERDVPGIREDYRAR